MMDKIIKAFSSDVAVNEGERAVTARISTAVVDRDGEVLIPQGMNSKDFEKNPIVFFNHDYFAMPVGKVSALKRADDAIVAKVVLAKRPEAHPPAEEWFPDTLLSLFQQNVLKGFSVGFIPAESRPATQRDIEKYGSGCGRVYSKWNLLELSVAPMPANQEAVAMAVSKGICSADAGKKVWGVEAAKQPKPEPIEAIPVLHVHRVLIPQPVAAPAMETVVRHAVVATIQKRAGKIYAD